MKEIRIIIAGSRDFNDYIKLKEAMHDIIDGLNKNNENKLNIKIISGTARGADKLGEKYANEYGYKVVRFIPDWNGLGKSAGYVRNAEMAKYAIENDNIGVLVAFWDGVSKGTKHMIDLANKHGLEVHIVEF